MKHTLYWSVLCDPLEAVPGKEVFGRIESVKIPVILVLTGYMLTPSGFAAFIHLRRYMLLWIPLKWSVILLKSR